MELPFDMGVLTERIAEFVSAGDVPFLQGRALTTGMKFTKALDDEFCGSLLDGALSILENHEVQAAPVLISAIESIASLCSQLGEARKDLIAPRIQMIMETLIIIAPKVSGVKWLGVRGLARACDVAWRALAARLLRFLMRILMLYCRLIAGVCRSPEHHSRHDHARGKVAA